MAVFRVRFIFAVFGSEIGENYPIAPNIQSELL
jgi:hypothetical protein